MITRRSFVLALSRGWAALLALPVVAATTNTRTLLEAPRKANFRDNLRCVTVTASGPIRDQDLEIIGRCIYQ